MSKSESDLAFKLSWDSSIPVDRDYFATLQEFPGHADTVSLMDTSPLELPEEILFDGIIDEMRDVDYPSNNRNWPLMSDAMVEVLLGVGEFQYRSVPVKIVDESIPEKDRYDDNGQLLSEIMIPRFKGIQLLEHTDAFDRDRSEFSTYSFAPDQVRNIKKLVLKIPEDGFPSLFRLSAAPGDMFVSAEARVALEKAGMKGIAFWTLDKV